ncbi:M20/M25/M40 family metallo-hydrolase [Sorangium cellulosum]|uniref:M20/M25/M40 family metallo-hydrolase n=1 Tax=Sorangium cellulosum TaxID=56 RepID=UPI001F176593|nr:M20/M25/M40 family metallo-hydrolase [Sorangium cellulosum]
MSAGRPAPRRAGAPRSGRVAGLLAALLGHAALAAALAACAPPPAPPRDVPAPPAAQQAPAAAPKALSIDPDPGAEARIKGDVTYLASPELEGRGTGEPGAQRAAEFIARQFAELGLTPLGGGSEGGARAYMQVFEARVGADVAPASLAVQRGGRKQGVEAGKLVTADGSSSGTVTGGAVLVGHGVTAAAVSWDDYGGRDIEGKIAVVLDGVPTLSGGAAASASADPHHAHHGASPSPADALRDFGSTRYKIRTAREHKAAGVILVAAGDELPPVPGDAASMGIPAVMITRSAARALFPTAGLAPPAKPAAAKAADAKAADAKAADAKAAAAGAAAKPAEAKPADAKPAAAAAAAKPADTKPIEAKPAVAAAPAKPTATKPAAKAPGPKPLDGVTVELTTKVTARTAPASNVIGLLPARAGSPRAGEYIVIGAHYDHLGHGGAPHSREPGTRAVHPGADDNASGTAMLLEVARRFAALPARPDRNLLFIAFGAEEIGTIGSRHFVEHPPAPLDGMKPVVAMINADMVGRMRGDKLLVDGLGTSPDWKPIVEGAAQGLGLALQFGVEGFGASDHASFTAARVPVAFLFTGVHEDYHRPSDTADKINAAGVSRSAVLAARMALALAQRDGRLPFADAPADPHRSMRGGFRASLGTMPDYAYQGPGVKVTGVRPDAPASRAGMQAGDVIVRIGTHAITNIHDFMFALGDLEPGREVVIEVDRGGTRVPIKVIPAPGR